MPRGESEIGPDEPIRLEDAARLAFPAGGMTVKGLRRERSALTIELQAHSICRSMPYEFWPEAAKLDWQRYRQRNPPPPFILAAIARGNPPTPSPSAGGR